MPYADPPTWVAGNPLPASELNTYVRDNFRFLHDRGSDLASATTVTPTTGFHKITGTTQIDNISAPASGLEVALWFGSALTVRNNGGGTGNIRTADGIDLGVAADTIIVFRSDGTVWKEVGPSTVISEVDKAYVQWTTDVAITATSSATAQTVVTATAFSADGGSYWLEFFCGRAQASSTQSLYAQLYLDGVDMATVGASFDNSTILPFFVKKKVTPAAGSRTYSMRGWGTGGTGHFDGAIGPGFIRIYR